MSWFNNKPEPGQGLEGLSDRLGSQRDADRLYALDHKRELTKAEGRELRDLEKRAGMR